MICLLLLIIVMGILWFCKMEPRYATAYHQLDYKDNKQSGYIVTFLVLACFSAVRDGIGVDYNSYLHHIQLIQNGCPNYMEVGFKKLVIVLKYLDDNPRLVMITMSILTCWFYLRAIWDQSNDVLLSVFIFLTWGYYFFTFNTVRNYFALSLVLFSIKYLKDGKHIMFIALVGIAALFHKSALICLPAYYLATKKYSGGHVVFAILLTLLALLIKDQLRSIVFKIYPQYEGTVYDANRVSYLNVFKGLITLGLAAVYFPYIRNDKLARIHFNLNMFSIMLYTGLYWLPEVSRIGFYFNATSIMFIPYVLNSISDNSTRKIYKLIFILGSLFLFLLLIDAFYAPNNGTLPYKTWLLSGY